MFRLACVCVVCLTAATASAQQWTDKLFTTKAHNFGSVPRAAKAEYAFVISNPFKEDLHISSVRSSCGCTAPRIGGKDTIHPGEKGAVIAAFNTTGFTGQHGARVTVTIDRPQFAEIVLDVKGYIRTDVVLNPGMVNLGTVGEGATASKKIRIEHAGDSKWKITDVKSNSPFVTASAKEIGRQGSMTTYELNVDLQPGAPAGYLKDQLIVSTSDRRATQFPVDVEGLIQAELSVSPTTLLLGTLRPGQTVTKQIVVKGLKPFKITDIQCNDGQFKFQPTDEAKTVHLVPVTFTAGAQPGNVSAKVEIMTDMGENKSTNLSIVGQVNSPLAGK